MIVAEAPGKLYLAGEYAVVEPGHRAVLVAVDRTVRVELEDAGPGRTAGRLHSAHAGAGGPLEWRHAGAVVDFDEDATGFYRYLCAATAVVEDLRRERGIEASHYDLRVTSGLDDAVTGAKFGLGSSAAVTVAAVAAIGAHYRLGLAPEQIYRLAMLATVRVTATTSGGDVAASALGGWVSYASPDRAWLAEQAGLRPVDELLAAEWPGLRLRRLDAPASGDGEPDPAAVPARVRVGWTGEPADTPSLVGKVRRTAAVPAELTRRSDEAVAALEALLAPAVPAGDDDAAAHALADSLRTVLAEARTVLAELASLRGTAIETPDLTRLVDAALAVGWAAKSSGAGGGDCGIALAPRGLDAEALSAAWTAAGIRPLDLDVAPCGARTSQQPTTDSTTRGPRA